jgi:hypothetical protein
MADSYAGPAVQPARTTFADALTAIENVDGWLTSGQAERLWTCAAKLPAGTSIVEIGSFHGRSAIVLALAAPPETVVNAIDPYEGSERKPQELETGPEAGAQDEAAFRANLAAAGVADRVHHIRLPSQAALDAVDGPVDLLFIDGAHRYAFVLDDIARWGACVPQGGTMLIHDGFSSIGVTLAVFRLLVAGRQYAYRGRTGTLLEYRRTELSPSQRATNALRQVAQLGYFVWINLIKLAMTVSPDPVLRRLQRRYGDWPH